jgi:hypothetical protein
VCGDGLVYLYVGEFSLNFAVDVRVGVKYQFSQPYEITRIFILFFVLHLKVLDMTREDIPTYLHIS